MTQFSCSAQHKLCTNQIKKFALINLRQSYLEKLFAINDFATNNFITNNFIANDIATSNFAIENITASNFINNDFATNNSIITSNFAIDNITASNFINNDFATNNSIITSNFAIDNSISSDFAINKVHNNCLRTSKYNTISGNYSTTSSNCGSNHNLPSKLHFQQLVDTLKERVGSSIGSTRGPGIITSGASWCQGRRNSNLSSKTGHKRPFD